MGHRRGLDVFDRNNDHRKTRTIIAETVGYGKHAFQGSKAHIDAYKNGVKSALSSKGKTKKVVIDPHPRAGTKGVRRHTRTVVMLKGVRKR